MKKQPFENVKIGDRVWSINYGWGKISLVDKEEKTGFHVSFSNIHWAYDLAGTRLGNDDIAQTLFWNEVIITPPPRPMREVTHKVTRWVNIYDTYIGKSWPTEEAALQIRNKKTSPCIATIKLTGTYTTMEEVDR